MNNKTSKNFLKRVDSLKARYGFHKCDVILHKKHSALQADDVIVRGLPSTTGLDIGKVAQNALKQARIARKLGESQCSYKGGK